MKQRMCFVLASMLLLMCKFSGYVYAQTTPDTLAYNQVYAKNAHNSFQRNEAIQQQLVYHRCRSLEFDFYNSGCAGNRAGDFSIAHNVPFDCSRSVDYLSDAYKEVKAFHDTHPNHEVITIFMDKHENFDATSHSLAHFESLATTYFGSALYKPSDLLRGAASLQSSISTYGWPLLKDLRGKIILVLTSGLNDYITTNAQANTRVVFASKLASSSADITSQPWIVFFNQDSGNVGLCNTIYTSNLICRQWTITSSTEWNTAISNKVHFPATDKVNYIDDSWSKTHGAKGYPFKPMDGTDHNTWAADEGEAITLTVTSNDIDGTADSFGFLYTAVAQPTTSTTFTYNIFVANENDLPTGNPKWGKAGLMARASLTAGSAYAGILAAADDNSYECKYGSRQSYRTSTGGSTTKVDPTETPAGIRCPYRYHQKMVVSYSATTSTTTVTVYYSYTSTSWTQIGNPIQFSGWLPYHGIAASSRETVNTYKYHFTNVEKNGVAIPYSSWSLIGINGATATKLGYMSA